MNSKWRMFFVSLAASLMLAACGTSDDPTTVDEEGSATPPVEEAVPADDSDATETENGEQAEEPAEEPSEEAAENGQPADTDALADAVETASDEQDYSIQVLPGYKLTSEEPGRDSLYLDEDGTVFMRIETMSKDQGTVDDMASNLKDLLEASSNGATATEITSSADLPSGEGISNVKGWEAKSEEGSFRGYAFESGDLVVRATLFDTKDGEHLKALTQMASTIK